MKFGYFIIGLVSAILAGCDNFTSNAMTRPMPELPNIHAKLTFTRVHEDAVIQPCNPKVMKDDVALGIGDAVLKSVRLRQGAISL